MMEKNNKRCFIIAEAGVNHNGDVARAKKLIDAAKTSGADAVKFQTWITELIVTEDSASAEYQEANTGAKSQFSLLKDLELSHQEFTELKEYAEAIGVGFLSTPDEEVSAEFLVNLGIPLLKIGSGELTNLPFLDFLAGKGLPMILSTGMATLDEVAHAVKTIEDAGNLDLTLLHCVSNYPAAYAECNLHAMETMRKAFGYPVGYSDHTMGNEMCLAAVAMGATVIEKHLTLDRTMAGPDHRCSSEPAEFKQMVNAIRNVEAGMGDGIKRPVESELATRKVVRKEIVADGNFPEGYVLKMKDLALKRGNGQGLNPEKIPEVVGRVLVCDVYENQVITEACFTQ